MEVVVTFLAMLELVKIRAIRIFQEVLEGPILIEAAVGVEQATETMGEDGIEEKWDGS